MEQKSKKNAEQVMYLDRWVDKDSFRAFVYSKDAEKLANSYAQYENLLMSGLWFSTKEDAIKLIQTPSKRKIIKESLSIVKNEAPLNELKSNQPTGL